MYRDKLEVSLDYTDPHDYTYGRAFNIKFTGLNADPGQFSIVSDDEQPLKGNKIVYAATTPRPYG